MTGLLPLLVLGLVLGMRHATDADHVVAISTIVTRQQRIGDAIRIGALWGLGHTVTIVLVGGAILVLQFVIPPAVSLAMEFAVALMLIGLGAYNLRGGRGVVGTTAATVRPVLVGVVHGLAGSAAVALLVLAAIPDGRWALAYLMVFSVGTIAGMVLITTAMVTSIVAVGERFARLDRTLQLASGALSVVFGLVLAVQIGLADGLFPTHPLWSAH